MTKKIFTKITHPELNVVNVETGEIVSGVATVRCDSVDDFIMCFFNSIPQITKLEGNVLKILMWCWRFSTFSSSIPEANVIVNNKAFKEMIRKEGGDNYSDSMIDRAVHILHKNGLLIRRCKGSYFLNPDYFFRGTLSNRARLQCNITYEPTK